MKVHIASGTCGYVCALEWGVGGVWGGGRATVAMEQTPRVELVKA